MTKWLNIILALGRFDEAVQLQEQLVTAGQSTGAPELRRLKKNLKRYRARSLGRLPFDAS